MICYNNVSYSQCTTPINTGDSNLTSTSVTLRWDSSPLHTSYVVFYNIPGVPGSGSGNISVNTNSLSINSLTPGELHQWRVYANCLSGGNTTWSAYSYFTTPSEIYGCTDSTALNYDSLATIDDGSCQYSSLFVSTTPENKNVILEVFTGISAGYDPHAHLISQNLHDANPNDVFLINIHTGGYSSPQGPGTDFRTSFGSIEALKLMFDIFDFDIPSTFVFLNLKLLLNFLLTHLNDKVFIITINV